jgi:predicted DCC family thiol-disulfide oxidoreductase YuxK
MDVAHVQSPPAKPLMVFDGDCHFCSFWIRRWKQSTGDTVEYVPFQSPLVAAKFPELPRERFEESVQLIEPNGAVYGGAQAVFRSLAVHPRHRFWLRLYEKVPGFAPLTEWAYGLVARHRPAFSALTKVLFGD